MPDSVLLQKFTYTSHKGPYLSIVGGFLFLCLSEGSLIVFLALHFLSSVWLKTSIITLISLFIVFIFSRLLFPLWTKHSIVGEVLDLRYGLDFHARIPLAALVSAHPVEERLGPLPVPRYDAGRERLSLAFSDQGQLLLRLASPQAFRLGRRPACVAHQLLISVDQRAAFLAALNLSPFSQSEISEPAASSAIASPSPRTLFFPPLSQEIEPVLALRAEHLTRRYASFFAVNDLNLTIRRGEIYGFLGANGAGKTTAMKMLVGLLRPTAGQAWLLGHDICREPLQAKQALGYVADRALLYERLSGREFLGFLAQLRGLPQSHSEQRISELLALLELTAQADRPCGSYSFGMKRKLSLAGALLHQPQILILDEPLNGLDPLSTRRLKDLFRDMAAEGTTIFLSTHDLATAESLCHRLGIIQHGCLLAEGSAAELRSLSTAPDLESVFLTLTTQTQEASA